MLHNNRLHVFFLFIVFAVEVGFPAPKQARGLENPPQNYEVPPSIPLQIVNLSVSPEPLVGQLVTLRIEIMSIYDESNVTIWVVLPEGVELVAGSLEWQGSLTANHIQSHELSIRVIQEGDWELRIGAFSTLSANNGYQDTETLHLISDFNSTNIVPGREYRITQPPDGMPGPTIPAKDISITSLSNPGTGQVTIEGQFKFEATEIKSKGPGNLVTNDVERAKVEVWDAEATGDRRLRVMTYDPQTKKYSATMPNIDSDGTGIDPFLKFYTTDEERVEVVDQFGDPYFYDYDSYKETGLDLTDGVYPVSFTLNKSQFTQALYIFDKTSNDAYDFLQRKAPSWGGETHWVQINYPEGCVGNDSGDPCFTGQIFIPDAEGYEPDVILHEYGHFVLSNYISVSSIIDACLLIGFKHDMWKPTNITCAWSEGWANFLEMAVQNEADYRGYNLEDVETDLQHNVTGSYPEVYEGVVSATLWDFFETPASGVSENWDESADGFNGPIDNGIWHFSTTYFPIDVPVRPPLTLAEFWNVWRNERPNGACLGSVILQHHKLDDFEPFVRTLTTSVSPSGGGSISINPAPNCPGNTYEEGTNITLNANPASGFAFQQWLGDATGSVNPLSVVMDTDKNIIADFNNPTPTVTSTPTATTTPTPTATFTPTSTPTLTTCTHWDLASEFRPSPDQENPNRDSCGNLGVWEFLTSSGLAHDPQTYTPAGYFTPEFQSIVGLNVWSGSSSYSWPFVGYNANDAGHLWPLHSIQVHPGNDQPAIIAWKSPITGYVSVTGEVIDTHIESGCGNGIEWYIDKGSTNLAYGGFENGGRQFLVGGTNGTNLNAVPVNVDERLYLMIAPKGVDYCDTTQINLSIDMTSAPATPTPLNGPTSTALPPNYTPPPITPAIPTATPPPPTSPAETCNCPIEELEGILCNLLAASGKLSAPVKILQSTPLGILDVELFHRVEDEILSQTPEGQHYIELYYANGPEIIQLLSNDPTLKDEAIATLQLWEPNLQALVDGQGGNVTITSGQVQAVQTFLDHLYAAGSPALRQTIDDEQAAKPLERTIGLPMNQASVYLAAYQGPPTATPTQTSTPTVTPTLTPTTHPPISINISIASGSDDAEENASGSVSLSSSDLELIRDANNQQVGLRFTNVTIPQGATILNAYIQFTVDETTSEATNLTIQAQANDNPVPFGYSASTKVSTRPRTTSSVSWSPSAWLTLNQSGVDQRTPDLSPVLQEIVNRSGWNSGNALAILITGTGKRVAVAYEGGANSAPRLHVEYTTSSAPTPTPTPTHTPTNTPIPGVVFGDGFESGNLSTWSSSFTDGGDLFVSAQSAAVGSYGMEAFIDDTIDIDVTDTTPNNETHYSARFYLNPNSVNLPNNESMYIFTGSDDAYNWKLCLGMRRMAEYYALTLCGQNDANFWFEGKSAYITDDWQAVEIEWQAASAVGANDGFAGLWVNDVLVDSLAGLDTDTSRISRINLGATDSIPAISSGSIYFDAFESRQGEHIGLEPNGPTLSAPLTDLIFKDDFESGDFALWSSTSLGGGDLSVSSPSALFGLYGMQAIINDTTSMGVTDFSPTDEVQYHARFYLDPNSISIPNNNGFSIFSAGGDAGLVFRVALNKSGGSYTLQTQAYHDAGGAVSGQPTAITDESQLIEVAFKASSAAGVNDGYLKLWLNDALVDTIPNLDNDVRLVEYVNLGATSGVDTGTSGTLYFDQFESHYSAHIGYYP